MEYLLLGRMEQLIFASYGDANIHRHRDENQYSDGDTNADPYVNIDADSDADPNSNVDTDGHPDHNANGHYYNDSDAYGDRYDYTDTYEHLPANTKLWRRQHEKRSKF